MQRWNKSCVAVRLFAELYSPQILAKTYTYIHLQQMNYIAYTYIVVTYNLILKIFNRSSAFSGLRIIVCNVLLFPYEITHVRSTFVNDTEVI